MGYGSQALALKYLGVNFEHWKICEWAVKSIQAYKDIHFPEDTKDYSKDIEIGQIKEFLLNKGISSNYNEPMSKEQINRLNEKQARTIYNNIQATHNLVNIQQVKGKDLEIVDTDKYDIDGNMLYNELCLKDAYFYYQGNIYYIDYPENNGDFVIDEYLTAVSFIKTYAQFVLSNSVKQSLEDLSENTEIGYQTFFCKKIAFTYCNLIKCFVSLQSNLANSLCNTNCEKTEVYNRDFLLSTIYVLDYLRDINNFKEAQRILDNINECGGFCKESETLTKCNCCG